MQKLLPSILFIIFLLQVLVAFPQSSKEETIIYKFEDNWKRFDRYYEAYIPIQKDELKKHKSIHQLLVIEKIRPYDLKFTATKDLAFFVNNKLIYKKISKNKEEVVLELNRLLKEESGEAILSFYHPEGQLPYFSTSIVNTNTKLTNTKINSNVELNLLKVRTDKMIPNSLILVFILIITLFVLFRQFYPKESTIYFSYDAQEVNENMQPNAFSIPNLWVSLTVGLSLGLMIYMVKLDASIWNSPKPIFKGILTIVAVYFGFIFLKFLYTSLIAWLFNYSKLVALQNSEYTKLIGKVFFFASIITYGVLVSGFVKIEISAEILYFSLILVLLLALIKVILLFFRLISHRNLYLFSYICAAEILPLIIAVKFLLF